MKSEKTLTGLLLLSSTAAAQQYVISTYAGGAPPPTPIAAVKMAIATQGIAVDISGNLYFTSSNCVFRADQNGIVTRVAGNSRVGYSGDGGPALSAQFRVASAVAVDNAGNLYVADLGDYRVRKVSPSGIVTTFAGTGVRGYSGDGGSATNAKLNSARGVAADNDGNLFIVDGVRIRKVSTDGIINTVAGNGSDGFSGDAGPAVNAQLSPSAVAADSAGNLYIADDGNLRVRKVSRDGIVTTVAGTGTRGMAGDGGPAASAQLGGAAGIAVDGAGNVYVTGGSDESSDNGCCIRKISPQGIITTVADASSLSMPSALAVDSGGSLYVADNSLIRKIASGGTITTAVGNGEDLHYLSDGGAATSTQLYWPVGVAADPTGNVYIADTFHNRVRAVSPAGVITTIAGNSAQTYSGDGGPATSAALYFPTGVAVDSQGNVYIADHGNSRIRKVSRTGIIATVLDLGATSSRGQVWSLAVDKDDNVYVPNPGENRISKISQAGVVTTIAGNGTHGYSGDGGPATNAGIRLLSKTALTTDREGNLYFSDDDVQLPAPGIVDYASTPSSPRIRKVSHDGIISTVAGNGASGFSGDGGPATMAQLGSQLDFPVALATDGAGNLYIADGANNRIRVVSRDGIIATVAGTDASGYTGDGGPAAGAQFSGPSGLAIDGSGNLYVADQFNSVVRLLQPVSSAISITTVANAASSLTGPISPGELVVISGAGLGPAQLVSGAAGSNRIYAAQLAGTTVQFNGVPAPLIYTWATQVAAVVPYSILSGTAQITVAYQGRISAWFGAPVAPSAPGVFTLDSKGKGQAVAFNQNSSINSPANPAQVGDVISLFVTGEGETTPAGVDGSVDASPAPRPILPVSVTIGGKTLSPEYAGGAMGQIAGLMRIDVRIPSGIQTGFSAPVKVQVGNSSSQEGVSISVH